MLLDENWVLLSTGGALIQRFGTFPASLCYATDTPTTEPNFTLYKNDAQLYPVVSGKSLYARSTKGCSISVEVV